MVQHLATVSLSKTKRRTHQATIKEGVNISPQEECIITNSNGRHELGQVLQLTESTEAEPRWEIKRLATDKDREEFAANKRDSTDAVPVAQEMIDDQGLPMELLGAEYSLHRDQLKFYFKAPRRVDFRGLLKELAREFSTRIELEQVGPRDAAAILGGIGRCGRKFCCRQFLDDPGPVPMELAQKQELSVSPDRLTGGCGRLLCCLRYELEDYEHWIAKMPALGKEISYQDEIYTVCDHNVQTKSVRLEDEEGKKISVPLSDLNSKDD